jgi:hypothetical protein
MKHLKNVQAVYDLSQKLLREVADMERNLEAEERGKRLMINLENGDYRFVTEREYLDFDNPYTTFYGVVATLADILCEMKENNVEAPAYAQVLEMAE